MNLSSSMRWLRGAALALVALLVVAVAARPAAAQSHPALSGGRYSVKIESAPPGATIYIDKKELGAIGVTPWQGKMKNGSYLVIIELDGYQPAQKNLTVARTRKLQSVFVPLIKKVDPPRIDIRADADQNVFGATVYLDGQSQGAAAGADHDQPRTPPGRAQARGLPDLPELGRGQGEREVRPDPGADRDRQAQARHDRGRGRRPRRRGLPRRQQAERHDPDGPDRRGRGPARGRGPQGAGPAVEADRAGHRRPADQGPR
jgi:hypothetical protein